MSNGLLLTVRKADGKHLILPGGKPEAGETEWDALDREIREELGCKLMRESVRWIGTFEDDAADLPGSRVAISLYRGELLGKPRPRSEIEELVWFSPKTHDRGELAPSLRNQILDYLVENSGSSPARVD